MVSDAILAAGSILLRPFDARTGPRPGFWANSQHAVFALVLLVYHAGHPAGFAAPALQQAESAGNRAKSAGTGSVWYRLGTTVLALPSCATARSTRARPETYPPPVGGRRHRPPDRHLAPYRRSPDRRGSGPQPVASGRTASLPFPADSAAAGPAQTAGASRHSS